MKGRDFIHRTLWNNWEKRVENMRRAEIIPNSSTAIHRPALVSPLVIPSFFELGPSSLSTVSTSPTTTTTNYLNNRSSNCLWKS
jgi:hypothetical protein